jgi:hypothetical protein
MKSNPFTLDPLQYYPLSYIRIFQVSPYTQISARSLHGFYIPYMHSIGSASVKRTGPDKYWIQRLYQ